MNVTLGQIKLINLFLRLFFFKMHPNALLAWQIFIMQKVGVTITIIIGERSLNYP
jgi:hypothetical protein